MTPLRSIDNMILYKKLFGKCLDISYLRVFGCICFVHDYDALSNKLDKKSVRCMFLGYDEARRGWRCISSETMKIYIFRHVFD